MSIHLRLVNQAGDNLEVIYSFYMSHRKMSKNTKQWLVIRLQGARFWMWRCNIHTTNFFWTRKDYSKAAKKANLSLVEEVIPKGLDSDKQDWLEGDKQGAYHVQVYKPI